MNSSKVEYIAEKFKRFKKILDLSVNLLNSLDSSIFNGLIGLTELNLNGNQLVNLNYNLFKQ